VLDPHRCVQGLRKYCFVCRRSESRSVVLRASDNLLYTVSFVYVGCQKVFCKCRVSEMLSSETPYTHQRHPEHPTHTYDTLKVFCRISQKVFCKCRVSEILLCVYTFDHALLLPRSTVDYTLIHPHFQPKKEGVRTSFWGVGCQKVTQTGKSVEMKV